MLSRMSSGELTEWQAYYALEPFGPDMAYVGSAITSSTLANIYRKRGSKAYTPVDFMPKFEKVEQTLEEQLQWAAMFTTALGGQDLRSEES